MQVEGAIWEWMNEEFYGLRKSVRWWAWHVHNLRKSERRGLSPSNPPRSLSNNSFLETKNATQYPAYSNLDFVVELLTSLHSPNYAYRLEYCLSDRLLGSRSVGWRLTDIDEWLEAPERKWDPTEGK